MTERGTRRAAARVLGTAAVLVLAGCQSAPVAGEPERGSVPFLAFQRPATDQDTLPEQLQLDLDTLNSGEFDVRKVGALDGTELFLSVSGIHVCVHLGSERQWRFNGTTMCTEVAELSRSPAWVSDGSGFIAVLVPPSCTATFPDQQVETLEDLRVSRADFLQGSVDCPDGTSFPVDIDRSTVR